jgi:hypothetical protein
MYRQHRRIVAKPSMEYKILALAPRGLTLLDVRRRVGGRGSDSVTMLFGPSFLVSPEFGSAIQALASSGIIRLNRQRGKLRLLPGRNYRRVS